MSPTTRSSPVRFSLDADVDSDAFNRAWQQVIDRHAALRTEFVWEKVKRPMQFVRSERSLPFEMLDWRDRTPADLERILAAWRDDGRTGFDLMRPPLMRITLIRIADACWYFVWSSHHLVLDRWC